MKKLVVVVVLLVLILGVAPWGVGKIAEGRVNKGLDKIVAEAPYLTIVERKWTGGWFRSEQEVTFELFGGWLNALTADATTATDDAADARFVRVADETVPEPMPEVAPGETPAEEAPPEGAPAERMKFPAQFRVTVKNEIMHGPVLWTSGIGLAEVRTKIAVNDEIRKMLIETFGTDEPVRFKTRVGLFGGGTTTIYGDGRTVKPKQGGEVSWEDFELSTSYSGDLDDIDVKGRQPRIEMKDAANGSHMILRGIKVGGSNERLVGDLYDTDIEFTLDELSGTGADKKPFSVDGIHYVIDTDKKGDVVNIGAKLGSGAITSPDIEKLGVQFKEVHYDFSFRKLHADTLAKMMTKMKEVYSKPLDTSNKEEVNKAIFGPLKEDAIALFKYDPELGIDRVGIVTSEGEGVIKGVIKFVGVVAEDFENPMALIPKLDVELNAEVPQKLIEKFPNGATMAGAAVDGGYMKREGDKLVCKLTFKNGELLVNGKPQAIPGLGGPPPGGAMAPEEMPSEEMPSGEPPPPQE
jgi:uncharacterized protein YdgA (DUF945 family)